jgi:hypothetical protein
MPWSAGAFTRTNGVHTGATLWTQDRDAGTKILASRHDTHDQDLAGGINSTLEKSGSNAATGNLNIGSNRLTAVADGTAKTDAATVNQIQSNAPAFQATDTGTANAHVIALSPAVTAYAAGQKITFKSGAASTTSSTLNINGLGVKTIKKKNDQNIAAGDIESGSIVTVVYDGTNFQMTSQLATDGGLTIGGSNTQVQYNSSGSLAGDADFTFDGSNVSLAKALYLADGAVATPSVTNTGDVNTGVYFPAADTVGVVTGGVEQFRFGSNPVPGGSKNLIDNGAYLVAQRGTSFTGVAPAANTYTLDRWYAIGGYGTPADRYTISQVAASAGALLDGFPVAIRAETTTAETSPDVNRYSSPISQKIELSTARQLGYGAAGAKFLTVSFWARSSQTGVHGITLGMNNGGAVNPQTYSVTSADTWEKMSVTFSPNTSTAIATTEYGLGLFFASQIGTAQDDGTQDTWGSKFGYTPVADIAGATSRYLEIAGVQAEIGKVATSYAHKSYGTEVMACWRYFRLQDMTNMRVFMGTYDTNANTSSGPITFPVQMRAAPTITFNGLYQTVRSGAVVDTSVGHAASYIDSSWCNFYITSGSLVANGWYGLMKQSGTCSITYSADL